MNITEIGVVPSKILDSYDLASRDLHRTILSKDENRLDAIRKKQEKVLLIRNQIALNLNNRVD